MHHGRHFSIRRTSCRRRPSAPTAASTSAAATQRGAAALTRRTSYTPNPWIGGALSLLLVARLAWRWQQGARAFGPAAAAQPSVLTLAFAATLVAYYLVNGGGLAWRMRRPA